VSGKHKVSNISEYVIIPDITNNSLFWPLKSDFASKTKNVAARKIFENDTKL